MARLAVDVTTWEKWAEGAGFHADELAAMTGRNKRQLYRDIWRTFGRSPRDWLNEQRVKLVERLLDTGELHKNAALAAGFHHRSSFSRWLKANGAAPRRERAA